MRRDDERQAASAARFRVEPKLPEGTWRENRDLTVEDDSGLFPVLVRIFSSRVGGSIV